MKKMQIGDFVAVDGELFDKKNNVMGTITNLCTHHVVIKDQHGFLRSVQNSDISHIHLIRPSKFQSYDEEKLGKDIGEA